MNLETLLQTEKYILAEGSLYELLRRSPEVAFDKHISHAGLIYNEHFSKVLEKVFCSYVDTAIASNMSITLSTATWRANEEGVKASGFSGRYVNEDNVQFLKDIRQSYKHAGISILIKGDIGPKGDAYKPEQAPDNKSAQAFHSHQINALASSGVDYLQASTLPALPEAIGIALVMSKTKLPFVISFVVNKTGCLFDGTKLSDAINRIDEAVGDNIARFGINCVHPTVLHQALDKNPEIAGRIVSFSGNTSDLSADELDGLEELQTQEPTAFAQANKRLLDAHDIQIVGACCGSNPDHIHEISKVLTK